MSSFDFDNPKTVTDNSERTLHVLNFFATLCQHRFVRFMFVLTIMSFLSSNIVFLFAVGSNQLEDTEIIQFLPEFCIHVYGISILSFLWFYPTMAADAFKDLKPWSHKGINRNLEISIQRQSTSVNTFAIFMVFVVICLELVLMVPSESDKKILFLYGFLKTHCPRNFLFLYGLSKFCYISIFISCVPVFQLVQVIAEATFQLKILYYYTEAIFSSRNPEAAFDEKYQAEIRRRLIIVINRHTFLLSTFNKKMKEYLKFFPCALALGFACQVSIIMLALQFQEDYLNDTVLLVRVVVLAFTVFITVAFYFYAGQKFQNENEKFGLAYVPWYSLNNENSKMYLMILMKVKNPMEIRFIQKLALNYETLLAVIATNVAKQRLIICLQVLKVYFSMFSLFYQFYASI